MPSLNIRNVPESIMQIVQDKAHEERLSIRDWVLQAVQYAASVNVSKEIEREQEIKAAEIAVKESENNCPFCGKPTVKWGPFKRCTTCNRNI